MFGNLGELFETKRPADILGKNKKNNKFLNGVLKFFGIQDGVAGLHKNYINEQLSHVDTEFTKEVFSYFSANTKAEIIEENTLRKKYNLETIAK
ncbi:TPA: hypothetical protein DEP21_01205 [Patescibacteria group bacterium]|nr:hypothetical protein [Candidatus Gracilibacteria bacterium]